MLMIKYILFISVIYFLLRIYFKRSLKALLIELKYRIIEYENIAEEEMTKRINELKLIEEDEYQLPKNYENLTISEFNNMKVIFLNSQGKGSKVFYLHGGAYMYDPVHENFDFLNKLIKKTDISVIMPVYPKAPKHDFKEAYEKVIEIYIESAKDDSVVLLGDSAGGGFTLGLAQEIDRLKLRVPKKIILISPWLDLSMENPEIEKYEKLDPYLKKSKCLAMAKSWANGTNLKDTRLSPIYGKLKVLNNISIIAGERDILYPDILKLVNMMKDENIEVDMLIGKNMLHDYPFLNIPEASVAINHMVNILKK
ncbi:alpha/beta hydrolase fold domain-containing protein [Streptobacillus canis]|uniref:alpha/beta hydrolase fold domain-containing protein n=1 Tax=Streptobacillus canis TaxID=2678686 RepID=UPI0012E265BD|nr:alpha/beta hydrolase [Streptobacillus canis]